MIDRWSERRDDNHEGNRWQSGTDDEKFRDRVGYPYRLLINHTHTHKHTAGGYQMAVNNYKRCTSQLG